MTTKKPEPDVVTATLSKTWGPSVTIGTALIGGIALVIGGMLFGGTAYVMGATAMFLSDVNRKNFLELARQHRSAEAYAEMQTARWFTIAAALAVLAGMVLTACGV